MYVISGEMHRSIEIKCRFKIRRFFYTTFESKRHYENW